MFKESFFVKIGEMGTDMTVDSIAGVLRKIAGVAGQFVVLIGTNFEGIFVPHIPDNN